MKWHGLPAPAGVQCLALAQPDGRRLAGWVISRSGATWTAYVPKVGATNPLNLITDGLLVGVYPGVTRAQTAVTDWLRVQGVSRCEN